MSIADRIRQFLGAWIDDTTDATVALLSRASTARTIRLEERSAGTLTASAQNVGVVSIPPLRLNAERSAFEGDDAQTSAVLRRSNLEIVLRPDRFVFRPLELPSRATEFLEGIVRSQIDRLTPWSPAEAAFGFTPPIAAGDGRVALTIAATARSSLTPWLRAAAESGARTISIATRNPDVAGDDPPITVMQQSAVALDKPRLRKLLVTASLAAALVSTIVLVVTSFVSDHLQTRQDELARRIAERRTTMIAARNAATSPTVAAERALAKRKNETPSTVIALEALSRILPDHTYVTELRIEGDRIRISGLTRDAPNLIRLVEQSRYFGRAAFFAPTTRGPNDVADRFHIETRMSPVFSAGL